MHFMCLTEKFYFISPTILTWQKGNFFLEDGKHLHRSHLLISPETWKTQKEEKDEEEIIWNHVSLGCLEAVRTSRLLLRAGIPVQTALIWKIRGKKQQWDFAVTHIERQRWGCGQRHGGVRTEWGQTEGKLGANKEQLWVRRKRGEMGWRDTPVYWPLQCRRLQLRATLPTRGKRGGVSKGHSEVSQAGVKRESLLMQWWGNLHVTLIWELYYGLAFVN